MLDPGLAGRDVEIPSGGIEDTMAQPQLNRAQVLARFQRMGGIAVAQRVRAHAFGERGAPPGLATGLLDG